jgi:amino acid transporter
MMGLRIIALILIFLIGYSVVVTAYSVGTDQNIYTVGTTQGIFTVGTEVSPIEYYFGAKAVVVMIPALLLLAFIATFGWIGFKKLRQGNLILGLVIVSVALILMGLTVMIGMPLIVQGVNSIVWFK